MATAPAAASCCVVVIELSCIFIRAVDCFVVLDLDVILQLLFFYLFIAPAGILFLVPLTPPFRFKSSKFVSNMTFAPLVVILFCICCRILGVSLINSIDLMDGIAILDKGFSGFIDAYVEEVKTSISVLVNWQKRFRVNLFFWFVLMRVDSSRRCFGSSFASCVGSSLELSSAEFFSLRMADVSSGIDIFWSRFASRYFSNSRALFTHSLVNSD